MFVRSTIKDCDMSRNLDLTALRSFVAVAEAGGVTRAAGRLNLTQSAVSMQLKRLETSLGISLLNRSTRDISPTAAGDRLLSYARRMLHLNDEAVAHISDTADVGEVVLGVPVDIVDPAIPRVLRQFRSEFPRIRVQLMAENTISLKQAFQHGDCHMILTTEKGCDKNGRTLAELPLMWVGSQDGTAWENSPLPLVLGKSCLFRGHAIRALESAGIDWEIILEASAHRAIEAAVSADLAVELLLKGTQRSSFELIDHQGRLPDLDTWQINVYRVADHSTRVLDRLEAMLKQAFQEMATSNS